MWESLGSTYVEATTRTFPLHRGIVFALGFMLSLLAADHEYRSLTESLVRHGLSDLASLDSGPLAKATFLNALLGLSAVCAAWLVARLTLRITFACCDRIASVRANVKAAYDGSQFMSSQTFAERKEALEFLESVLEEPRARMKSMTATTELLVGVGLMLLVGSWWGNRLDMALGFAALIGGIL